MLDYNSQLKNFLREFVNAKNFFFGGTYLLIFLIYYDTIILSFVIVILFLYKKSIARLFVFGAIPFVCSQTLCERSMGYIAKVKAYKNYAINYSLTQC